MTAASKLLHSDSEKHCVTFQTTNIFEWGSCKNVFYLTTCAVDIVQRLIWSLIVFHLCIFEAWQVKTQQELGNMVSHFHMCTPMSSRVNTKLTLCPPRLIRMDGFVLYAGRPAALTAVRPPEWFVKWTRHGCGDSHARRRTHTCTLERMGGRQHTPGECLHAVVLKAFKKSPFHSMFISINHLNISRDCLLILNPAASVLLSIPIVHFLTFRSWRRGTQMFIMMPECCERAGLRCLAMTCFCVLLRVRPIRLWCRGPCGICEGRFNTPWPSQEVKTCRKVAVMLGCGHLKDGFGWNQLPYC